MTDYNTSSNSLLDESFSILQHSSRSSIEESRTKLSIIENVSKHRSDKRNQDYHALFKGVPKEERLIEDYGCAIQKEILLQGRIYISKHHICFNSNIFGWITNLIIAFDDVQEIEKRSTAIFIPNAIQISTTTSRYLFASFLFRDHAFDQIVETWHYSRNNSLENLSSSEEDAFLSNQCNLQDKQVSLPSLSTADNETLRRRAVSEAGPRPRVHSYALEKKLQHYHHYHRYQQTKTKCACEQHYPTVVMDKTYSTTIETIYHILYNSNFMQKFLSEVEKSTDVCIGQWIKLDKDVECSRESSYVKQLNGSIGPKSTKCYLKEDMIHLDMNNYISQLTVTHTPNVPSGNSFQVKTRTCITYVGQRQVRVLVTVLVEFTKSSWLKSVIEKATLEGQQSYYKNLDDAINHYLNQKRDKKNPSIKQQQPSSSQPTVKAATLVNDDNSKNKIQWIVKSCVLLLLLITVILLVHIYTINQKLNQLESRLQRQQLIEIEKMIQAINSKDTTTSFALSRIY